MPLADGTCGKSWHLRAALCQVLGDHPGPQVMPGRGSRGEVAMTEDQDQLGTAAPCVTEAAS